MDRLDTAVRTRRGIIFDLFHTLTGLESEWSASPSTSEYLGVSRESWNEQLLLHSHDRLIGRETDPISIIRAMAHAIDAAIPEETIREAAQNRTERFAAALAGIPEENIRVLQSLRGQGKRLAMISNADVMEAKGWPRSPAASLFDVVMFSCDVGTAKPDPAIYRECLRRLGLTPAQCLFVGDGGSDELRGARSVGLMTVMVAGIVRELWPERIPARRKDADYVIERLPELLSEGVAR